jgi:hypothetical protein
MSVRSFMQEFRQSTEQYFYETEWCWRWQVIFTLRPHSRFVTLARIRAIEKGHGHGSAGLDWLCALADRHGVRLSGIA